jgi:hypothetical protein
MKKIIFGLLFLASLSASANTLNCEVNKRFSDKPTIMEGDVGLEIKTVASCSSNSGPRYLATIHGGGVALYGAMADGFLVYCPFQTEIEGAYYGLSIKAAFWLGLGAGAFASDEGACVIGRGSAIGIGASVEAARLTIERL